MSQNLWSGSGSRGSVGCLDYSAQPYTVSYSASETSVDLATNTSYFNVTLKVSASSLWADGGVYGGRCQITIYDSNNVQQGQSNELYQSWYWYVDASGQVILSASNVGVSRGTAYRGAKVRVDFWYSSSGNAYAPAPINRNNMYLTGELQDSASPPTMNTFTVNKNIIKPGSGSTNAITLSWTASSGQNNNITGYEIKYMGNGGTTTSTTTSFPSTLATITTTTTSSSMAVPYTNFPSTRGRYQIFGIKAKGEYIDSDFIQVPVKINLLPSSPIVNTISTNKVVSSGGNVIIKVTPGVDNDNQNYSLYYNWTSSTNGASITTTSSTYNFTSSSSNIYFWTYDGLEFSPTYASRNIIINTKPTFTNFDWNETTYTANGSSIYTNYLQPTFDVNKGGTLTEEVEISGTTYTIAVTTLSSSGSYTRPTIYMNNYFSDTSSTSQRTYMIKATITDDMGESYTKKKARYVSGAPDTNIVINNFSNTDINPTNKYYNKIRLLYRKDTDIKTIQKIKVNNSDIKYTAIKGDTTYTSGGKDYDYFDITITDSSFLHGAERTDVFSVYLNNGSFNKIITTANKTKESSWWSEISSVSVTPTTGEIFNNSTTAPQLTFADPMGGNSMNGSYYTKIYNNYTSEGMEFVASSSIYAGGVTLEQLDLNTAFNATTLTSNFAIPTNSLHDKINFYLTPIFKTPFTTYTLPTRAVYEADLNTIISTGLSVDIIESGNATPLGYYSEIEDADTKISNHLKCTLTFNNTGTHTSIGGELQYSFDNITWTPVSSYDYAMDSFSYPTNRTDTYPNVKIINLPLNIPVDKYNYLYLRAVSNRTSTNKIDLVATASSRKNSIYHVSAAPSFNIGTVTINTDQGYSIPIEATWDYGYGYFNGSEHVNELPSGYTISPVITVKDANDNTVISNFTTFSTQYIVTSTSDFNGSFKNLIIEGTTTVSHNNSTEIYNTKSFTRTGTALAIQPLVSYRKQKLGINTNTLQSGDIIRIFSPTSSNFITLQTPSSNATISMEDFLMNNFIIDGGELN